MVTPGTRLRDDLYVLYLVALSWFVLPVYGKALALAFPSHSPMLGRWVDVVVAALGLAAVWWGLEGGPLVVSRAAIVHELGAPTSRGRILLPRLIRQALTAATFSGVGGGVLVAMNGGAVDSMSETAGVSVVCGLAAATLVLEASVWLVVFRARLGPRGILGVAAAIPPVGVIAFVASGASLRTGAGIGVLAAGCCMAAAVAVLSVRWIPVEGLWRRASALESMRSAMQTFDFQRALLDLRRANDRPEPGRLRLARPWMPLPLWRQVAAMQHGLGRHAARIAALGCAVAAMVAFADVREGLVVLALAGCSGLLGFEFSAALAATADQGVFAVHYRRGSGSVLRGQLVVMLVSVLTVAVAAAGWRWAVSPSAALSVVLLCGYGALGAGLQARLGSPNLGSIVDTVGLSMLGPLLWGRAMLGPAVLLVGAFISLHALLVPASVGASVWPAVGIGVAIVAAVVVTWPIEKNLPGQST